VRCRRERPPWDGILILGGYADDLRAAILRIKRPGAEHLTRALAALLVERRRDRLEALRIDAVVPVPMHWWRRARRGTSDADEVARAVARAIGVGAVPALVRARATRMQNELPPEERGDNVAGAFRARRGVAGRRLLLVDDVVTTGATLAACCEALRGAGAAAVYAAALAKADRMADAMDCGER
jgi:ComF family protein